MILTAPNPDGVFARALKAGATEIFPVGEEHGWRLGRLADPFGVQWEIGHQIASSPSPFGAWIRQRPQPRCGYREL
jgi:PhnB protein